jgi:hypothetical protein
MKLIPVLCLALASTACAGTLRRPPAAPQRRAEALLVLPGFGYGSIGERTFQSLRPVLAAEGIDLYIANYLTRDGLASGRAKLDEYIQVNQLGRYERLHVFAFLAGAWTVNPLFEREAPPNLATVVYDRSPFQERAPAIAVDRLRVFAWLRYGSTIFDVARTPYPPLTTTRAKVGVLVESSPTRFVKRHAKAAQAYGPFAFACADLHQLYDDCGYVPLDHEALYARFDEVWPDLRAFIHTSRFTTTISRTAPSGDALREAR